MLQTTAPALSTDDLDVVTTGLARRVQEGTVTESDARMAIYEAVFKTGLVRSETLRWCRKNTIPMHLHEEMVDAAEGFYLRKILDLPNDPDAEAEDGQRLDSTGRNGKKFFDLPQFADGASAAGSIRQALGDYTLMFRTLYRSVNKVRKNGQVITSSDLLEGNLEVGDPMAGLLHELPTQADTAVAHVLDNGRSTKLDDLYEQHRTAVNGQRGVVRTQIDATVVRDAFDLPELERPLDPAVRTQMLAWVQADPTLAYRSIVAFYIPDADDEARALGQLWHAFDDENLEAITTQELGEQIADLLVRDALADRPRPGKPVVARLRALLKSAVAGRGLDAQWAARLAGVFVDHEHEQRSAWDVEKTSATTQRNADAYLAALVEAATLSGSPLGDNPAEVRRTLEGMILDARQSTPSRRAKRTTAGA